MSLHSERFPDGCGRPDCFGCRIGDGPTISGAATPSRTPQIAIDIQRDRTLERDLKEYKTLRAQGYQPPQVGGSAERARTAESAAELQAPHPSKRKGRALRKVADRRSERVS